jgi:hypothetical protein
MTSDTRGWLGDPPALKAFQNDLHVNTPFAWIKVLGAAQPRAYSTVTVLARFRG